MFDATAELLVEARPHKHFVQLHDGADDGALLANIGRYLAEGLIRGEGGMVIATEAHRAGVPAAVAKAGFAPEAALRDGRLLLLDAHEVLDQFLVDGQPDPARFTEIVGGLIRDLGRRTGGRRIRAYGEMVGVLWTAARYAAAIRLEELWNTLLADGGFELFCAYPIDVFGEGFHPADVDALLATHTHLLPAGNATLQHAVDRAMDEVLGPRADGVRQLSDRPPNPAWPALPTAEASILWLRANLPAYADEIVARARRYYRSAAA
jgi:hypothetical protein